MMEQKEAFFLLKQLISKKESEHFAEGKFLKGHFQVAYQSMKPINLIKSAFKDMISSPDFKTNVVNAAIGLTAGFVVKKIFIGKSPKVLIKLSGIILELVIANKVSNNADEIKAIAGIVLKKIIHQCSNTEAEKDTRCNPIF